MNNKRTFQRPLLDASALASTASEHGSSHPISSTYLAIDMFRGGKNLELYVKSLHNIQQIQPSNLSFFDFAMLTDSIHDHEPNYSALSTNCFWYAKMICDVVIHMYACEIVTGPFGGFGGASIYQNDYLPDISGRVLGVLISRPDNEVPSKSDLVEKCRKNLAAKRGEVSLFFILNASY